MSLPNTWHLRTVAEAAAKPCMICFKPSTAVMITPDNKDFFYICRGHLKDTGFCSPLVDLEAQRMEALEKEKEKVVKEYKEKVARREKAKKAKDKDKKGDKDKNGDEKEKEREKEAKEEKDDEDTMNEKLKIANENAGTDSDTVDLPRIYSLHRNFYQMRLDRIRKAEIAKRNRERLANPSTFPSVPNGDL